MFLRINELITEELPEDLNIQERKILCQKIIDKYPDYFSYRLKTCKNDRSGEKAQNRLSVMAAYLYKCVKPKNDNNVMTNYKERRNRVKEIKFSEIGDYDNDNFNNK